MPSLFILFLAIYIQNAEHKAVAMTVGNYQCIPCGRDCDNDAYDKPGKCEHCHMDHPALVDGLVITGPAIGPGREKVFWFTSLIESPAVRWFIPRMFKSANTEKIHHKEELEKMLPFWKNIRVPVMYLQGAKDNLIDTSNASFARQKLVNAPYLNIYFFPNRYHYLAQYEWPTIRDRIMVVSVAYTIIDYQTNVYEYHYYTDSTKTVRY